MRSIITRKIKWREAHSPGGLVQQTHKISFATIVLFCWSVRQKPGAYLYLFNGSPSRCENQKRFLVFADSKAIMVPEKKCVEILTKIRFSFFKLSAIRILQHLIPDESENSYVNMTNTMPMVLKSRWFVHYISSIKPVQTARNSCHVIQKYP